jgi:subfamily B ATP-binding cassette protein MsbA
MDLKEEAKRIPVSRVLRWYVGLYGRGKYQLAAAALLALLQAAVLVPIPLVFRHIIDVVVPASDLSALVNVGLLGLGLYLAHGVLSFFSAVLSLKATKRVTEMLRARLCIQLQQMSLRFYDRERVSELHSRVVMDTERTDVMGNAVIVAAMSAVMMFFLAAAILSWLNFWLFAVTICLLPLYFLTHEKLKKRLHKVHKDFRDGMEMMNSQVNDLLQAIRLVKTFAREEHEQRRAEDRFSDVTDRALRMTIFSAFFNSIMGWIGHVIPLTLYVVGGYLIIRGSMSVGDLVAFVGMVGFMIHPINVMFNLLIHIYQGLASLGPIYLLLHFNEPLEHHEGKLIVQRLEGSVEFENVSVSYDSTGKHALRGVSVKVNPGETIALVGESGAGKSTFAHVVLGFYLPNEGTLRIDGRDIRTIDLRSLRERIGVVSQDNVLLNTSIRENLLYGRMEATEQEMIDAARNANALEFIERLPDKFDAVVGDRGTRLSGGQRQRLAIARALLKDPQILILDEATSALDSGSEAVIQEALERLQKGRTCFIIAHRLSTVVNADRILVMKDGAIVESGPHVELVARGGEYARLCERQFGKLALGEHVSTS